MHEKENAEKTRKNFQNYKYLYIPKYFEKQCSEWVLTMEFVQGAKVKWGN